MLVVGGVAVLVEQVGQQLGGFTQGFGGVADRDAGQVLVDLFAGGGIDVRRGVFEACADDLDVFGVDVAAGLGGGGLGQPGR